jgi:hypothetical protein
MPQRARNVVPEISVLKLEAVIFYKMQLSAKMK